MSGGAACPVRLPVNKTACPCPLDEAEVRWEKLIPCPIWTCFPSKLASRVEVEENGDFQFGTVKGFGSGSVDEGRGNTITNESGFNLMWVWSSLASMGASICLFLLFLFVIKPFIVRVS